MEASLLLFADDTGLAVNTWDNLQNTISEFCELQQIVKKERLETRNDNFFYWFSPLSGFASKCSNLIWGVYLSTTNKASKGDLLRNWNSDFKGFKRELKDLLVSKNNFSERSPFFLDGVPTYL